MHTAILVKPGVIELSNLKLPEPSSGEMLIKIKAALTCGTDLKAFKRGHPVIPMPGPFGHEFSGIVAAVGSGVDQFREGDAIMAVHSAPCLSCRLCKLRLHNLCDNIMQTKILGAFSEYILLPRHIVEQNVFHKPPHLPFEEAAFLEPLSCVVHGMNSLSVKKREHALIAGAGPIGLIHLLLLKERGALVTVMDLQNDKLMTAKKLGAERIVPDQPNTSNRESKTPNVTDNSGFDYVFECTGSPEVWEKSVQYVRRGGTVVLFGGCKPETTVCYDAARLHYDEITIKGSFHYTPADVRKAYELLSGRKINLSGLISGFFSLKDIQQAFETLSKGIGIKYVITP